VLAINRYDAISERKLIAQLHQLSPEELLAIEEHERAHQARPAVLESLGYARQGGADAKVVDALRAYERNGRLRQQRAAGGDAESGSAAEGGTES
jgi:hypothetical protein